MASASSEPKKRQQGFAVPSTVLPTQQTATGAGAISPAFASPAANSSYIDTSYLLDDEMWRTMTVDTDISKGRSQGPAQPTQCEDHTQTDAIMEDLSSRESATNDQPGSQVRGSRYPWDDGLHHLDDWLGLPTWPGAEDGSSTSAITPGKITHSGALGRSSSVSAATPDSGRGIAQRVLPRLDGSPFTESSFSTGDSMSSSEQTTSVQSSSVLSSSSPVPRLSSTVPVEKPGAPASATAVSKPKRQRSVTVNTSTAAPESVSTILENSRTGRTATSGASSSRRAVSANGRSEAASKETKASASTDRNALAKEASNGGVGKASRVKTGRTRRTSIGPAALIGSSSSGKKDSPTSAPLHIDTSSAAATMSSGPQTFSGMPTMAWNSSPWPAGMYHHPPPAWGHFAPGGLPYGTFPPGWPVWGSPQSMPMHPAWSLPMNGGYIPTPTPGGSSMHNGWPTDVNPEGSLSPGVVQSLSLPMTSPMQGIFSSMQGLHVGTVGAGLDSDSTQHLQAVDTVRPPFQPTGQTNSWSETEASLTAQGAADAGRQKSPSLPFCSAAQQDGAFPWNLESLAQKPPSANSGKVSSQSDHDERLSEEPISRQDGFGRSTSTSPPALAGTTPHTSSSLPTTSGEAPGHHRKSSRSLNRTGSMRGSKLEDVPEGETVHSHSPPASFSRGRVAAPDVPMLQKKAGSSTESGTDKTRRLSDSRRVQLPDKVVDSKKKREVVQEDDDDDGDDDNLLEGEDDDDDDLDEDDDAHEDNAVPSRKPTRGRGSGSSRPVRSEQERRKRRRESHNLVERRRRDTINERIAELASLLPEAMLLDAIAHSQGGGNNSKVVQVAVPEEILSRLNSAGRHEMGGGSTLDILSLASAPANSETLALAQARPNKGIILRKSVDYIRALQEFIEQQGKHARMLREEVERVTGLLEESKANGGDQRSEGQVDEQGEMKRLWPTAYGVEHTAYPRSGREDAQPDQLPRLGLFRAHHDGGDQQEGEQSSDDSPTSGYPQLGPGQSPPPTLAEWLAAAHSHQQQSVKGKIDVTTAKRGLGDEAEGTNEAMAF